MIWTEAPGNYKKIIDSAIQRYKKSGYKGKIKAVSFGWEEYMEKIESAFHSGNGPDIFSIEPGGPLNYLVKQGFVKPLDKYFDSQLKAGIFSPLSISSLKVGNSLFAVPISMNNMQLFVNEDLADEYKIRFPNTLQELIEIAGFLDKKGIICIATGFADRWAAIDTFVVLAQQLSKSLGKNLVKDAERGLIPWRSKEFIKVMDSIKLMADKKVFPENINQINFHQDAFDLWCKNKALFLWPANNAVFASIPQHKNLDAVWFPRIDTGQKVLTGGVALCWSVYSKSNLLPECIHILKEMVSTKTRKMLIENGIAHSGIVGKNELGEGIKSKINLQQNLALDRRIYDPYVYQAIGEAVVRVIAGKTDVIDALGEIKQ
ncbi:MAG: ABC transporter substrate-binding protein [Actinomycetota bacterium]